MMPPVEVPTIKSKWSVMLVLRSSSSLARTAAEKSPLMPPPSSDRIWKRSYVGWLIGRPLHPRDHAGQNDEAPPGTGILERPHVSSPLPHTSCGVTQSHNGRALVSTLIVL